MIDSTESKDDAGTSHGPYYYTPKQLADRTSNNDKRQNIIVWADRPFGQVDSVEFYLTVAETCKQCKLVESTNNGIPYSKISCTDKVTILDAVYWQYDPNATSDQQYSFEHNTADRISNVRNLIKELTSSQKWNSILDIDSTVEVK